MQQLNVYQRIGTILIDLGLVFRTEMSADLYFYIRYQSPIRDLHKDIALGVERRIQIDLQKLTQESK